MIALLLFAMQTAPAPVADIVVMGERLKRLRFSAQVGKDGRVACKLKRSSGNPAIDALPCAAVQDCDPRHPQTAREVQACVKERLEARFSALTAR